MDIANNWTIVIGIGTIISLALYWSQEAYLKPIVKDEEKIKQKVKSDISNTLEFADDYVERGEEEQFVDEIYDIIKLKRDLRDMKDVFRGKMVPIALILMIVTIGLVTLWELNNILVDVLLAYILILLIVSLITLFMRLRKYERNLSRYLEK